MGAKRLPGEYLKRSLVSVEYDLLQAAVFLPERAKEATWNGRIGGNSIVEVNYVVSTHKLDDQWTFTVEQDGITTLLPPAVLDKLIDQREAIRKKSRSDKSRDQARARLAAIAEQDQEEGIDQNLDVLLG